MTSARQLRELIRSDPRYSHLVRVPIDHAIAEIRRLRRLDAENDYHRCNARGGYNDQDRAYEAWKERVL